MYILDAAWAAKAPHFARPSDSPNLRAKDDDLGSKALDFIFQAQDLRAKANDLRAKAQDFRGQAQGVRAKAQDFKG